ncbi:hypothetical protein [Bordetella pseudohinzii]|uniref:Uncharacterized protein n=1 Tax=Bordetella pseudohinzii TaxID=1331258 RepID=A0A0J6C4A0_9BORD|nr:hypothetical protein [Bordetella pseudohinzii]ANY18496.1 hypothetical protein BBN53_20955 [Bordetella pseudohinzii]KMM24102.1 hypothetical protein L540_08225 [Bordetella pseudohinzii]KXA77830.1 hypothetical protein AW878_14130 [Bordetella pseudohinzii]KXA78026.1 hypothetical protein AW877_12590 [Bordetella pseudohinzii]CUJ14031.1 Uncharacterised protein [Bordetella pseudohinzii]
MAINIRECWPLLNTILMQQRDISERLGNLILTFKREPEPVEPTLRTMLKPITTSIRTLHEATNGKVPLVYPMEPTADPK